MSKADPGNRPIYRGRVNTASGTRGFAFIDRRSLEHINGPEIEPPTLDLILWLNDNPRLGERVERGTWVVFSLAPSNLKTGWRVHGAVAQG